MATGFHYEDVPPQNWLDELHSLNIPRAWDVQINNTQRQNLIRRGKEQLKSWQISLREQIKKIRNRYDASNRDTMEQMLQPYQLLDNLGTDLHSQLGELEQEVKAGKAIPEGFEFGSRIFGDLQTKRWQLGERDDEGRWQDFLKVERRYRSIESEYEEQSQVYKNTKQLAQETQDELKILTKKYDRETGLSHIGLRLLIVVSLAWFTLVLAFVAMMVDAPLGARFANEVVAAIMMILAVVSSIAAVILARRRRQAINTLGEDVSQLQNRVRKLRQKTKHEKQHLLPTRQTLKEVYKDYKVLKSTF